MDFPELLPGYRGARGLNFYEADAVLRKAVEARVDHSAVSRLHRFGALCGNELGALIEVAHQAANLPKLVDADVGGEIAPVLEYCADQKQSRALLAYALYGQGELSLHERMSLAVLANFNGEGGITCPLAMTEGLIGLLERRGTNEQKAHCLPLLRSTDPDNSLTGGQYVTERQGGSNVSANETVAKPAAGGGWSLWGTKWFCSNPGELWVTTAKIEGTDTIALFLVRRKNAQGRLNGARLDKLKPIGGTKGKATAEVTYNGALAELIGKPREGLSLLVREILTVSRYHSAAASLGFMSRALMEAELFANYREAYGRKIKDFPSVARALAWMRKERSASVSAFFQMIDAVAQDSHLAEALVPMCKVEISRRSSAIVHEAQLLIGGHGILEDFSILPRLADDAVVNEIWEGTHNILAGHAAKALRKPRVLAALEAAVGPKPELRAKIEASRAQNDDERNAGDAGLVSLAFSTLTAGS